MTDEDELDITEADEECNECGCIIDSCGYCIGVDCVYNDYLQDEELDEQ